LWIWEYRDEEGWIGTPGVKMWCAGPTELQD
jgi:hypothetical protein